MEQLCGIKQCVQLDQIIQLEYCASHLHLTVQGSPHAERPGTCSGICAESSLEGG